MEIRAAFRSLWRQGVARAPRREYFNLLWHAVRRDLAKFREAVRAIGELDRKIPSLFALGQARLAEVDLAFLSALVDRAKEAAVRANPEQRLEEIATWAANVRAHIEARTPTADDVRSLYRWAREYFVWQRRLHTFPGVYLVKAFNLAIKGLHYETVMNGIVREANADGRRPVYEEPSLANARA
jgi:hypothetical protein